MTLKLICANCGELPASFPPFPGIDEAQIAELATQQLEQRGGAICKKCNGKLRIEVQKS